MEVLKKSVKFAWTKVTGKESTLRDAAVAFENNHPNTQVFNAELFSASLDEYGAETVVIKLDYYKSL